MHSCLLIVFSFRSLARSLTRSLTHSPLCALDLQPWVAIGQGLSERLGEPTREPNDQAAAEDNSPADRFLAGPSSPFCSASSVGELRARPQPRRACAMRRQLRSAADRRRLLVRGGGSRRGRGGRGGGEKKKKKKEKRAAYSLRAHHRWRRCTLRDDCCEDAVSQCLDLLCSENDCGGYNFKGNCYCDES